MQAAFFPVSSVSVSAAGEEPADWIGDLLMVGMFEDDLDTSGVASQAFSLAPIVLPLLRPSSAGTQLCKEPAICSAKSLPNI